MTDMITSIVSSLLGGLVGGLFTYLGVRATIKHENEKAAKEELRRQKEKEDLQYQLRPRFEITDHSGILDYLKDTPCDVSMIFGMIEDFKDNRFYYNAGLIDCNNWKCVQYTLKNIGATEIDHLYFSTNLTKNTALFDVNKDEYKWFYYNNVLNCSVYLGKYIKPQETIRVQICYCDKQIIESNIGSAPITIWMADINGIWWSQPIFAPDKKLNNSTRTSHKEWRDYTDEKNIRECFNDPTLW